MTATQRMNEVLDLLDRFEQLTYADVRNIVTVGVWQTEVQQDLFNLLARAKQQHVPSPALVPNLEVELRKAVSYTFRIVDKVGGISGVGSLVFKREARGIPWAVFEPMPHFLVRNFAPRGTDNGSSTRGGEGQFGRISGLPRTGKTNLACFLLEKWSEIPGCVGISNILPAGSKPTQYTYVKDSKSLLETIALIPDEKKWLFVLDEGGLIYGKADASTRRAKDLDKLVRVLGKLHGNMVIVEQRVESVPTIIQEFAMNVYFTQAPGVISVELKGPTLEFQTWLRGFPKTGLDFDTYDIAYFNVETEVASLFEALSGKKNVKQAMKEFLSQRYKSSAKLFRRKAEEEEVEDDGNTEETPVNTQEQDDDESETEEEDDS